MAKPLNEEIVRNVRALIGHITHYEGGTDAFNAVEKCILTTIKKSDSMYFLNTKDIQRAVWSMAEKFTFHGFFKHAEYLKQLHDKYIVNNLSESDVTPRLNFVKFLLCCSQNPTTQFWMHPELFEFIRDTKVAEPVVDWGVYLNEGIERWSPTKDDSDSDEIDFERSPLKSAPKRGGGVIAENDALEIYDFRASRMALLNSIQNDWFSGKTLCMEPPSDWLDANIGILWEQHLQSQVQGLIKIEPVSVISEYKVMREVLWQMWGPHNSTVFELSLDKLIPKANVTISSVCSVTFEHFLWIFVSYIEVLDGLRQFYQLVDGSTMPETYKSYAHAMQKITKPIFADLVGIEERIRLQDCTMTLLQLASELEIIFKPVLILQKIHHEIIADFYDNTVLDCTLKLLTRLRKSLQFSVNKLEQDIRLTLYLESLYYYFTIIDAWLIKNDLSDFTDEFVILNKNVRNSKNSEDQEMNFVLKDNVDHYSESDGIVKLICNQVLQIGRNIHLLRLLGKCDVFAKGSETIHQEFLRRILEELSNYYGCENLNKHVESLKVQKTVSNFHLNRMGDWTDYVDMSDGFLSKAFESFYVKTESSTSEPSLFERVANITTNLFPLQSLPEKVFGQILKERFTISGLMVKSLLVENYNLDKQFEFFNHVFLFADDLIFPLYRRLFVKMNTANSSWGNSVWLTLHLQDILMDSYPNFYEDCAVKVDDHWRQCKDSIEALSLLRLQYKIKWPLSIIITEEQVGMYNDLFQFILKIKWALYTVNHLSFIDLEPKKISEKSPRASKTTIKRLKYLRFNLINILNALQHYLFGVIFTKYRIQFELDFEKSNDLRSLITSHEAFIKSIYQSTSEMRDKERNQCGFHTLLKCVKILKVMWNDLEYASVDNLEICRTNTMMSSAVIHAIVNPAYVFDY